MAENKSPLLLKIVLIIFAVVALVYGLCYVFIPGHLVKMAGSEPVFHGWLMWSGGVLIALGIGAILVIIKPEKQDPFVITVALGCLFTGLALIYAWITSAEGTAIWFTAVPAILTLLLSALLWWSRYQARDILCPGEKKE
jgi:energy-converting hydrogenase Eha subunit E